MAAQCIAGAVVFWLVVLLVPWTDVFQLLFGFFVWLYPVPALTILTICACVECMNTKGVFKSEGSDHERNAKIEIKISKILIISAAASVILAVAGLMLEGFANEEGYSLGQSSSRYFDVSENSEKVDRSPSNICKISVDAFLRGQSKYDANENSRITMQVNGRAPVNNSVCSELINTLTFKYVQYDQNK